MGDDMPRRLRLCEWCSSTIQQPRIGRRRVYCGRTCRELAYRERKTQRRMEEAAAAREIELRTLLGR